jgi:hypothetical protein
MASTRSVEQESEGGGEPPQQHIIITDMILINYPVVYPFLHRFQLIFDSLWLGDSFVIVVLTF